MMLCGLSPAHQAKISRWPCVITVPLTNHQPPNTIIDCEKLDHTLLEYCHTHFAKAQSSPFTVDPLQHLLCYDGLTPFVNLVLKG